MTKYMSGALALVVGLGVATADAAPYTFFSGTVKVNNPPIGGAGTGVGNANRVLAASGGFAYNNTWTGSSGGTTIGSKLTATGVFPLTGATFGISSTNFANSNIVGVYAFEGVSEAFGPGRVSDFDPSTTVPGGTLPGSNAGGVLQFFDRGAGAGPLVANDPTTWTNGTNPIATLQVTERADNGYFPGPPGPTTTVAPAVIDPSIVNGIALQLNQPTLDLSGDFKLEFLDFGTLFSDLQVFADFDGNSIPDPDGTFRKLSEDLFTNLDQVLQIGLPQSGLGPDDITPATLTALNALFDQLLDVIDGNVNQEFSSTVGPAGDEFNNAANNNIPNNTDGDVFLLNNGGNGIPGGQFEPVIEPEPTTVAIWGIVGVIGFAAVRKLKPKSA